MNTQTLKSVQLFTDAGIQHSYQIEHDGDLYWLLINNKPTACFQQLNNAMETLAHTAKCKLDWDKRCYNISYSIFEDGQWR